VQQGRWIGKKRERRRIRLLGEKESEEKDEEENK
jgi:hypothetical protein